MTVIKFDLPPQIFKEETEQELDATGLLLLGIAVSVCIGVPSEIIYDGILSAQIISHMPLSNVNFPRNLLLFLKMLNKAVSFNLFDPTMLVHVPWDFTPTPPYYDNFGWL